MKVLHVKRAMGVGCLILGGLAVGGGVAVALTGVGFFPGVIAAAVGAAVVMGGLVLVASARNAKPKYQAIVPDDPIEPVKKTTNADLVKRLRTVTPQKSALKTQKSDSEPSNEPKPKHTVQFAEDLPSWHSKKFRKKRRKTNIIQKYATRSVRK